MNRIILIGNGFDLAHGLKTSYADFIEWYWEEWGKLLLQRGGKVIEDEICSFKLNETVGLANWHDVWHYHYGKNPQYGPWKEDEVLEIAKQDRTLCDFTIKSRFFQTICKEVETKNWVDIEDVYYDFLKKSDNPKQLNDDLEFLKGKLIEYLQSLQETAINPIIKDQILSPISQEDIAIGSMDKWKEMLQIRIKYNTKDWIRLIAGYEESPDLTDDAVKEFEKELIKYSEGKDHNIYPLLLLPNKIMLLNFNYTNTADMYLQTNDLFSVNHIHGSLSNPESVIFGYGDEHDDEYQPLMKKNDNEYLRHIKSFRYLESSNYRKMLGFIELGPYQVCIMGHSCGISDRTLLSTLFEHPNCVSIKPYYYRDKDGKDNYFDLICNIARSISDPHLMRDRVVRKERCQPLG